MRLAPDLCDDLDHDEPEYRYVTFPRCPECRCKRLLAYRSVDAGDGSRTKYVRCADCGRRLVLIIEWTED